MVASTTLVLHGLRLRSPAGPDAIAARFGLDPADVGDVLDSVTIRGWAQHRTGRVSGWSLTADGRRAGERMLAAELDATGQRAAVEGIYDRFLGFNADLLSICTDWQVVSRDGIEVPNDHSDGHHDEMVLTRLADLHREFRPITDDLAASLHRFAGYRERLALGVGPCGGRGSGLDRPPDDRLLPHRLVRTARGPAGHARTEPDRRATP